MKKNLLALLALCASMNVSAQDIQLPKPNQKEKSMSVVQALATRHSVRSYDTQRNLSPQQLSNLCWAAFGMSRDDNHRTAPTAMNRQEIRLYVFNAEGAYEYEAKTNKLIKKADGDHRKLFVSNGAGSNFGQQWTADAPVTLLMVIDFDKFGSQNQHAKEMTCVDAGNVSQNINLYCQAVGLATVPRATHDREALSKLLGLTDHHLVILNNPVGYEKK